MFGLLKLLFFAAIIGGCWLIYDISTNMSASEKKAFRQDTIEALESGDPEALSQRTKEKVSSEIQEKKSGAVFYLKEKIKNWLDTWADENN